MLTVLCGFWEQNLGSLQENPVLLTGKLSLQPLATIFEVLLGFKPRRMPKLWIIVVNCGQ